MGHIKPTNWLCTSYYLYRQFLHYEILSNSYEKRRPILFPNIYFSIFTFLSIEQGCEY